MYMCKMNAIEEALALRELMLRASAEVPVITRDFTQCLYGGVARNHTFWMEFQWQLLPRSDQTLQ